MSRPAQALAVARRSHEHAGVESLALSRPSAHEPTATGSSIGTASGIGAPTTKTCQPPGSCLSVNVATLVEPPKLLARDAHLYPEIWAERETRLARVADEVARPLGRRRLVRVAVGHAIVFETWRSLVRREGLTNGEAADAMVAFVSSV